MKQIALVGALCALVGCGGGGSSDSVAYPTLDAMQVIVDTGLDTTLDMHAQAEHLRQFVADRVAYMLLEDDPEYIYHPDYPGYTDWNTGRYQELLAGTMVLGCSPMNATLLDLVLAVGIQGRLIALAPDPAMVGGCTDCGHTMTQYYADSEWHNLDATPVTDPSWLRWPPALLWTGKAAYLSNGLWFDIETGAPVVF